MKAVFPLMWCALLISFLTKISCSTLFGIHVTDAYNETEHIVNAVSINPTTGNFTVIVESSIIVGDALIYNAISAFDSKKNIMYYSLDLLNDDVAAVDVIHASILPPINIGASAISVLVKDVVNEQLLITGMFADNSTAIYSVPDNGAPGELLNLTESGVGTVIAATMNATSGMYYFIHLTNGNYEFANFPVASPKTFKSVVFPCGTGWQPLFLFYDPEKLIGLSGNAKGNNYEYFEIADGKCTTKSLGLSGVVICATYDPTAKSLFISYSSPKGAPQLCSFSSSSHALSCGTAFDVLTDIEAASSSS